MLEIKLTVATSYPQLPCKISLENWTAYKDGTLAKLDKLIVKHYGGFTKNIGYGGYTMNGSTNVVYEDNVTYTVIADNGDNLKLVAEIIRDGLFQESVLYTEKELKNTRFI